MALETPSRPPPPMANAILNFHFDYLNPSLIREGGKMSLLGKPLFEMCWYYVGIAQVALDPSPLCQTGKRGKNCPKPSWQALTTLQAAWGKRTENHPGKPL